jgi:hypothetical protein
VDPAGSLTPGATVRISYAVAPAPAPVPAETTATAPPHDGPGGGKPDKPDKPDKPGKGNGHGND